MRGIILFASLMILISCKNKNSQQPKNIEENTKINDFLTVKIKAKVLEDDIFEIYYAEDHKDPYLPEDKVRVQIKGGSDFQQINFKFPDRTYPMKFRIDIGLNRHETSIEISEIKLSTGKNERIFLGVEIAQKFRYNKFIEYEPNTNNFKRSIVNGVYDPFLLSIDLSNEIVDLFSD